MQVESEDNTHHNNNNNDNNNDNNGVSIPGVNFPAPKTAVVSTANHSDYRDQRFHGTTDQFQACLSKSSTLYVGNLSFYTTEEQVYELFSKCGDVKRIIMGLDRFKKTPCGFCFVEYYTHDEAMNCILYISGTMLDERIIRADWDAGFQEGRQYGMYVCCVFLFLFVCLWF